MPLKCTLYNSDKAVDGHNTHRVLSLQSIRSPAKGGHICWKTACKCFHKQEVHWSEIKGFARHKWSKSGFLYLHKLLYKMHKNQIYTNSDKTVYIRLIFFFMLITKNININTLGNAMTLREVVILLIMI